VNETVRKIVPVAELPPELRSAFDPDGEVEIVGPAADPSAPAEDLLSAIEAYRRARPSRFRSPGDVVDYVRAVRDGGDLEPWLGPCSTSTPTS
jgi:hypothetical protein